MKTITAPCINKDNGNKHTIATDDGAFTIYVIEKMQSAILELKDDERGEKLNLQVTKKELKDILNKFAEIPQL